MIFLKIDAYRVYQRESVKSSIRTLLALGSKKTHRKWQASNDQWKPINASFLIIFGLVVTGPKAFTSFPLAKEQKLGSGAQTCCWWPGRMANAKNTAWISDDWLGWRWLRSIAIMFPWTFLLLLFGELKSTSLVSCSCGRLALALTRRRLGLREKVGVAMAGKFWIGQSCQIWRLGVADCSWKKRRAKWVF